MPVRLIIAVQGLLANDVLCRAFTRRKDINVVGSAQSREELLKQVAEHQPDVVLMSASLEGQPAGGLRALSQLRPMGSRALPIILLDRIDHDQVLEAFSHGARGVTRTNPPTYCANPFGTCTRGRSGLAALNFSGSSKP